MSEMTCSGTHDCWSHWPAPAKSHFSSCFPVMSNVFFFSVSQINLILAKRYKASASSLSDAEVNILQETTGS